jgi:hypothetical protein
MTTDASMVLTTESTISACRHDASLFEAPFARSLIPRIGAMSSPPLCEM